MFHFCNFLGGAAKITLFFKPHKERDFFSFFCGKKIFLALFFTQKVAFLIGTYLKYFLPRCRENYIPRKIYLHPRGCLNYIVRKIHLHPEGILKLYTGSKIDGIPLFQLHPIVNRFMIGYK